ncbi:MAG: phosphoribosylaminoimidazolesuccinocarboxamide synthase [Candidatus Omnitrophica bacterium]|nr:phosphoribosylaminoimidazolesuccinocarboxamide synthase [Candidatus Omnitrophota bacterium]
MAVLISNSEPIMETRLPLPLAGRGKVRDIYEMPGDRLLIVSTDRLSAFDVVLPNPIPLKGRVLTQLSVFWLRRFENWMPHHLITADISQMGLPADVLKEHGAVLEGRTMLVKKARPLAIECVVRGYVAGSGWKDYLRTGAICGHELPRGIRQCEKLQQPIFTPATKESSGHDINISRDEAIRIEGEDLAREAERMTLELYEKGRDYAESRGILIADTKFEFGVYQGQLILIDEVLTPDSSRFWPKEGYESGHDQPSYDKQIVRNYLLDIRWNQTPPGPELPQEVVQKTSQAYRDVYKRLTGLEI